MYRFLLSTPSYAQDIVVPADVICHNECMIGYKSPGKASKLIDIIPIIQVLKLGIPHLSKK